MAMDNMGFHYSRGIGVEQDYVAAMGWYKKAAEAGSASSMEEMGDLYYFGNGIEQDMVKAREWYRKALETGVDDEEAAKIKMKLDSFD